MPLSSPALRKEVHYGGRVVSCYVDRAPSIDALFRRAVATAPERIAVADEHERLTYRALDARVDAIAGNLARAGIAKGERLALLVGNRIAFLEIVLACVRVGIIVVPMSVRQKRPEVAFVLEQCQAAALVYDAAHADTVPPRESLPSMRQVYVVGGDARSGEYLFGNLTTPATPPVTTLAEDDVACLLYTSGTTGRPKGACLTHLGLTHAVESFRHGMALSNGEISVLAVPASHVTGLVAILLTMIAVAGTTVMMREFKARRFIELAASERMTHALMVPAMYNLCLLDPGFASADVSSWRVGGFGGAPMPEATIARLGDVVPGLTLLNIYGATETTSPATMMFSGEIAAHRDTVGRALACADMIVMDADGREMPRGTAGELWIAGPMVIPGYWDNPAADAAAFVHGYWRSGDIGSIDAAGFVRILDRTKDVINRGGYKIYSVEVENVLAEHPDVIESAVVPRPDDILGQRVHAVIVPVRANVDIEALRRHCAERLSDYKVPTTVTLRDTPLPRNANGRCSRRR